MIEMHTVSEDDDRAEHEVQQSLASPRPVVKRLPSEERLANFMVRHQGGEIATCRRSLADFEQLRVDRVARSLLNQMLNNGIADYLGRGRIRLMGKMQVFLMVLVDDHVWETLQRWGSSFAEGELEDDRSGLELDGPHAPWI